MEQARINESSETLEDETNTELLTYMVEKRYRKQNGDPAFEICLCNFDGDEGDFYQGVGEIPDGSLYRVRTIASVLDGPNPERDTLLETLICILLTEAPNAFVAACAAECREWLYTQGEYSSGSRWDKIADCLMRFLPNNPGDLEATRDAP